MNELPKKIAGIRVQWERFGPEIIRMAEAASPERQMAMAEAAIYFQFPAKIAGPRLQSGPGAEVTARWILGAHPTKLAGGFLTHAEAGQWILQNKHHSPKKWLWENMKAKDEGLSTAQEPHDFTVLRWIQEVLGSPKRREAALRRGHRAFGMDDIEGSVVECLDEIRTEDLHKSPVRTMVAARQRAIKDQWDGPDELIPKAKWETSLPPEVQVIRSYTRLYREGREMRHCAASYGRQIADRTSLIFSIKADEERSTLEIRNNRITQHVGFGNQSPPEKCVKIANNLLNLSPWVRRSEETSPGEASPPGGYSIFGS